MLLVGPVDHELATTVAAKIMALDADRHAEIQLHVSAEDGELTSALMLADIVDLTRSPVACVARGVVGGAVLAPLCAATRRLAAPNVIFRLREPRITVSGDADELTTGAEAVRQQVDQLHRWVARATGRPQQTVADDMRDGMMLTAQAAVAYGLVEEIFTGHDRP